MYEYKYLTPCGPGTLQHGTIVESYISHFRKAMNTCLPSGDEGNEMPDVLSEVGDILVSAFFAIMGYAGIHLSVGAESLSELGTVVSYAIVLISVVKLVKHFYGMCFALKSRS